MCSERGDDLITAVGEAYLQVDLPLWIVAEFEQQSTTDLERRKEVWWRERAQEE